MIVRSSNNYVHNLLLISNIAVQVLFEETYMTLSEGDGEFRVCAILQTLNVYPIIESSITLKLSPLPFPSLLLIIIVIILNRILSR